MDFSHYPAQEHPYFITDTNRYITGRLKQWLGMMSKNSEQAMALFQLNKATKLFPSHFR